MPNVSTEDFTASTSQPERQLERQLEHYDVVVVGGGMVGSASALAMAKLGLTVALLEPTPPTPCTAPDSIPNQRVSAIQRSSELALRELGAWSYLLDCQPTPFYEMRVSDWQDFDLTLSAHQVFEPNLGYLVENDAIAWAVWQALGQHKTCHLYPTVLATAPQRQQTGWRVTLNTGQTLSAKLIIAGDGAKSFVRESLGIQQSIRDYNQSCIVGTVQTEICHQSACWQYYRSEGPFALLPLRQINHCSIAWYLPPEEALYWLSQPAAEQAIAMTEASGGLLGNLTPLNRLHAFPLIRRQSHSYVQKGVVLVGDAAHTVHPQAGQGVNLGFLDVMALYDILREAIAHHQPIDDVRVLKRYERRRKSDAFLVQSSMESLNWLFADQQVSQYARRGLHPFTKLSFAKALVTLPALFGRSQRNLGTHQ